MIYKDEKIILPGGSGLVGQNLIARLVDKGYKNILVLDKHKKNLNYLRQLQPDVGVEYADLAKKGSWIEHFENAKAVIMLQAQIGGNDYTEFYRNNVESTKIIIDLINDFSIPHLVHVSSSVVASVAEDFYTITKRKQEEVVLDSGIKCPIFRPTLMFGWFDRKHLGWLSRFMQRVPVFPIPGDGRYMRQPLYVGDFCNVLISSLENEIFEGVFNISGHERIDYIDIIREIKRSTGVKTPLIKVPYHVFYFLLFIWGVFDKNPPFTTQQLAALTANDDFEVIDWPKIFGVSSTPFFEAIHETFNDPRYSKIVMDF